MFRSISLQIRSMDPICLVVAKDKDNMWSCTWSVRDWGPVNYCVVAVLFGSTCEELLECPTKNTKLLLSLWAGFTQLCQNNFPTGLIDYPFLILRQTDTHTLNLYIFKSRILISYLLLNLITLILLAYSYLMCCYLKRLLNI